MKKIKLLFYTASVVVFLGSCTGKDGAPGAAGPAGNANVSTQTFTITPGSWSNPQSGEYTATLTFSGASNLSGDVVVVYGSQTPNVWLGLPTSNFITNGDQMEFAYGANNNVAIVYLASAAPTVTCYFKVADIPPSLQKPHINYSNYSEVAKAYNFKD